MKSGRQERSDADRYTVSREADNDANEDSALIQNLNKLLWNIV
jgi:hypothetical protein